MPKTNPTRMGDGEKVWMSSSEIRAELQQGVADAAELARIPALADDEIEQLRDRHRTGKGGQRPARA